MTKILEITALTTDEEIEAAMPFLDMQEHAKELRDYAKAPCDATGKTECVIELHEIDGVTVLWNRDWAYAYVNERSPGIGNSLVLDNETAPSPEVAVKTWRGEVEAA